MAAVESRRGDESDAAKRIYPGGAFDPLNFAKGDINTLKLKEIKNGRLAMMACLGFVAQVWIGWHCVMGGGLSCLALPCAACGGHMGGPHCPAAVVRAAAPPRAAPRHLTTTPPPPPCVSFVQHAATGKTPLQALSEHISNPWGSNFATNGVSLPF